MEAGVAPFCEVHIHYDMLALIKRHDDEIVTFGYVRSVTMARRASQVCPMPMAGAHRACLRADGSRLAGFGFGFDSKSQIRIRFVSRAQKPDSVRFRYPTTGFGSGCAPA